MAKNNTKKFVFSSFLLYLALVLSVAHLTFLVLGLFGVLTPSYLKREFFNYIVAFILLILCLALYITIMVVEKKGKLFIPEWIKVVLYLGFYIFTNIYYYFGFFGNIAGLIILYAYLTFVINIIALAVFFNTQKNDSNTVKSSPAFITISVFSYSVACGAIIEVLVSAVKMIFFSSTMFASLSMSIIDMCVVILISIIMAIIFALSLGKTKTLINNCLIKYYK